MNFLFIKTRKMRSIAKFDAFIAKVYLFRIQIMQFIMSINYANL